MSGGTTVAHSKESRMALVDNKVTANNGAGAAATTTTTSEDPANPQHNNFAKLIAQAKKRMKRSITQEESKEKWKEVSASSTTMSNESEIPSSQAKIPNLAIAQHSSAYASAAQGMPSATTTPTATAPPLEQALIGIGITNSAPVIKVSSPAVEVKPGLASSAKKSASITSFLKPKANAYPVRLHGRGRSSKTKPSPSAMHQRGRPSICGPWNCHVCTFFNKRNTWSRAVCEMCSAKRKHLDEATAATPAAKPADEHCTVFLDV
jgi:hypothetical protein